jgi:hypothetical protein
MVVDEVYCTPIATTSAIALSMNKTFLSCNLFNKDGQGHVEFFKGEKLDPMLLKCAPLCSLGIRNLIVSLKLYLDNSGSIDYILKLKAMYCYDYIHDRCFPSQQARQKVYLFKMFINGAASKFDLVR